MQEFWKTLKETWKTNPAVRVTGIAVAAVFLLGLVWFGREIAVFVLSVLAVLFRAKVPKPAPHDPPKSQADESLQSGISEAKASKDAAVFEEKRRAAAEKSAILDAQEEAFKKAKSQSDDDLRSDVLNWRPPSPPTSSEAAEPSAKKEESDR